MVNRKRYNKIKNKPKRKTRRKASQKKTIQRKNNRKRKTQKRVLIKRGYKKNVNRRNITGGSPFINKVVTACTEDLLRNIYKQPSKVLNPKNFEEFKEGLLSLGDCGQSKIQFNEFNQFYQENPVIIICAHGSLRNSLPLPLPSNKYLIQFNRSGYHNNLLFEGVKQDDSGNLLRHISFYDILDSAFNKSDTSLNLFKEDDSGNVTRNLLYVPICEKYYTAQVPCQKLTPPYYLYNDIFLDYNDHNRAYSTFPELNHTTGIMIIGDNRPDDEKTNLQRSFNHRPMVYRGNRYDLYTPKNMNQIAKLSDTMDMFEEISATVFIQACKIFINVDDDSQELARQLSSSSIEDIEKYLSDDLQSDQRIIDIREKINRKYGSLILFLRELGLIKYFYKIVSKGYILPSDLIRAEEKELDDLCKKLNLNTEDTEKLKSAIIHHKQTEEKPFEPQPE